MSGFDQGNIGPEFRTENSTNQGRQTQEKEGKWIYTGIPHISAVYTQKRKDNIEGTLIVPDNNKLFCYPNVQRDILGNSVLRPFNTPGL